MLSKMEFPFLLWIEFGNAILATQIKAGVFP